MKKKSGIKYDIYSKTEVLFAGRVPQWLGELIADSEEEAVNLASKLMGQPVEAFPAGKEWNRGTDYRAYQHDCLDKAEDF